MSILNLNNQNQKDLRWKLYARSALVTPQWSECCDLCKHVTGNENLTMPNDKRYDYLFSQSIKGEVVGNGPCLHKVCKSIAQSQNPFEDFDSIFNNYFRTGQTRKDIIFMTIFERIFLRVLSHKNMPKKPIVYHQLHENATSHISASAGLLGVGVSATTDRKNKDDIPQKITAVQCSNDVFQKFSELFFTTFSESQQTLTHQISVGYLMGKVEQMFRITQQDPIFIFGRRNVAYSYLTFVKRLLLEEFGKFQNQRIQIHELVGQSGIGKSLAVANLSTIVQALVPAIPEKDLVYTRANDYWWNGYCGQPIILYDDLTHIQKKIKFDLLYELISVGSGTLRNPPMAFDKETRFTSQICIVTSNIPVMTTTRQDETCLALKRRIISQRWKPVEGILNEDRSFAFSGIFLNSIESGRSVFSLFSETQTIIDSSIVVEFSFNDDIDIEYDDEFDVLDSEKSPIPMLTSSVPESYSAMIGMGDQTREVSELVSADDEWFARILRKNHKSPSSGKPIEDNLIDDDQKLKEYVVSRHGAIFGEIKAKAN